MAATGKRKRAKQEATEFSFSSGAARYANKNAYATGSIAFAIVTVEFDPHGGYTGDARWKVTVMPDDTGETEIITLSTNPKRDEQLRDAKNHILKKGPIPGVRLVKRGNAFYFRTAQPRGS
jgi:hypothetical protein